ncbi:MAG: arsenic resistance N-acetyltransferase ArsN2 [Candidatus Hodarchaeota archaeon]
MLIEKANNKDLQEVLTLLNEVKLPKEGVAESFQDFFVIRKNSKVIGCIGIEKYGEVGLMRSAAIHPSFQGQGYGKKLVEALENYARDKKLVKIYLLTDTAEKFFIKFNYKVISREKANPKIKQSVEYTTICTSSPLLEKEL